MSLIDRILNHSHHARDKRARDPESHAEIPYGKDAPASVRIGAWILKTSWFERAVLKWSAAITTALTAWLVAKGGGEHTGTIVAGVAATLTFLYEQFASYLNSKATMKIPPHVGGQSLAPVAQTVSTSDSGKPFTRSEMFAAIIAKPTSPADDDQALLELRKAIAAKTAPPVADYGYSVEVDGEQHDFIEKLAAIKFRDAARADGKTANLL